MSDETRERYSDELLECVEYLLAVDNPLAETRYGGDFNRLTAEPSETLGIVRRNAYVAVDNCETGEYGPVIPEDRLFVEVELKIQDRVVALASRSQGNFIRFMPYPAVAIVVAIAGLISGDEALWLAVEIGGFVFGVLVLVLGYHTYLRAKHENIVSSLARALRTIQGW